MIELAEKMNQLPFFANLDPPDLRAVVGSSVSLSFDAGETVFWEGEDCTGIYIVESGWLKAIKISLHGREQVIRFL
jgi:CRP/FNR family transcriptional regulator